MARFTIAQAKEDISRLKAENKNLKDSHEQNLSVREKEWEEKEAGYEEKISELEENLEEKELQINKRELKKLAEAYSDQEKEFLEESKKWFKFVLGSLGFLLLSILVSNYLVHGEPWYERIEYYLANFVFITLLIFSLKQYSSSNHLRVDFANRKTLAQSYHNIISKAEDVNIKNDFIKEAMKILCAPADNKTESYTLPEKLIDGITDIAKNLSKKV